ncbi:hypothetical protein C2G38_2234439 [Gigaspora rosea]|uniref:CCHC-type domain-containing protein n=1 Tax=Gigaspora rosea TaxID=44941 RepID=A0A397TQC9_9GLOM|nr:hypothetical protein C2G38_2234439 [Gigaspora rosea]
MTLSYRNVMPDQSSYQQQYRSQGYSRLYGNSRFFRQSRNPGVVCFICEEQGHIAWDCPQKKSGQPFRIIRKVLERGYKTCGISDGMAEEQVLLPKGMKSLVQMKVLRQIKFIGDKLEWVEQELERLMKMQAVKLIYEGKKRPKVLLKRVWLGRIVEDDQEKLVDNIIQSKKWIPLYSDR